MLMCIMSEAVCRANATKFVQTSERICIELTMRFACMPMMVVVAPRHSTRRYLPIIHTAATSTCKCDRMAGHSIRNTCTLLKQVVYVLHAGHS